MGRWQTSSPDAMTAIGAALTTPGVNAKVERSVTRIALTRTTTAATAPPTTTLALGIEAAHHERERVDVQRKQTAQDRGDSDLTRRPRPEQAYGLADPEAGEA